MLLLPRIFKINVTIHVCILIAFVCLLLSSITNIASDLKVRKNIQQEYERTENLLTDISSSILNDFKFKPPQYRFSGEESDIEIDPESLTVTLTFKKMPSSEAKTLKFIPLVSTKHLDIPLEAYLTSEQSIDQKSIRWVCTSSLVRSRRDYIRDNIGSLPSEIAPPNCRYWITPFDERLSLDR